MHECICIMYVYFGCIYLFWNVYRLTCYLIQRGLHRSLLPSLSWRQVPICYLIYGLTRLRFDKWIWLNIANWTEDKFHAWFVQFINLFCISDSEGKSYLPSPRRVQAPLPVFWRGDFAFLTGLGTLPPQGQARPGPPLSRNHLTKQRVFVFYKFLYLLFCQTSFQAYTARPTPTRETNSYRNSTLRRFQGLCYLKNLEAEILYF